jgi:hypothetical protein
MTRYGHLSLSDSLHERLLGTRAATIDRLLADVREQAFGGQRKRRRSRQPDSPRSSDPDSCRLE